MARIHSSHFDHALECLREVLTGLGSDRVVVTVREDGRVYLRFEDGNGYTQLDLRGDLHPDVGGAARPNAVLHEAISPWRGE